MDQRKSCSERESKPLHVSRSPVARAVIMTVLLDYISLIERHHLNTFPITFHGLTLNCSTSSTEFPRVSDVPTRNSNESCHILTMSYIESDVKVKLHVIIRPCTCNVYASMDSMNVFTEASAQS